MNRLSTLANWTLAKRLVSETTGYQRTAFSNKVDTEEEEEEDKEDSPAPTDSVSVEFIDNTCII